MEDGSPARMPSGWRKIEVACGTSAVATLLLMLCVAHGLPPGFWALFALPLVACIGWVLSIQPTRGKPFYVKAIIASGLVLAMAASALAASFLVVFVLPD
jgi:hypothetical protein